MDNSMNPSERTAEDLAAIKRPKVIRVATLITIFMTLVILLVGGFCLYWTFTGRDVLKFNKDPIPVKPKVAKSEQQIILDVDFCKYTDTPGRVIRRLVSNRTEVFAPTVIDSQQSGCYQYDLPIPIPPQTAPGIYHVNYRITYETNPFHTITEEVNSEEFEVVN